MSNNQLTSIPASIASCTNLILLYVFICRSWSWCSLVMFTCTHYPLHATASTLSGNLITAVPDLTGLTKLGQVFLAANRLTGSVPDFSGLTGLFTLVLVRAVVPAGVESSPSRPALSRITTS